MQTLTRYCLVESHHQTGSYSLHMCVHDWTLTGLNAQIDTTQYWPAFNCLASHIGPDDWDNLSALRYQRFVPHAVRLVHEQFQKVGSQQEWLQHKLTETRVIARLLKEQVQYKAAERMYVRALAGSERRWDRTTRRPSRPSTISGSCIMPKTSWPRRSRCTSGRWPGRRRRWDRTTR